MRYLLWPQKFLRFGKEAVGVHAFKVFLRHDVHHARQAERFRQIDRPGRAHRAGPSEQPAAPRARGPAQSERKTGGRWDKLSARQLGKSSRDDEVNRWRDKL